MDQVLRQARRSREYPSPASCSQPSASSQEEKGGFEPFGTDYQAGTGNGASENGIPLRLPGQWVDDTWADATSGAGIYQSTWRWLEPQTGRYSRPDPLGLPGSHRGPNELVREGRDINLYSYALQNPIRLTDPAGLAVTTSGCTARLAVKIQTAAADADADAASQTCLPCNERAPFRKAIRSQGTSHELIFECVPWNINPKTGDSVCGTAPLPGEHRISITPQGAAEVPGCGCLKATIMHEVLHVLNKKHNAPGGRFKEVQKCFSCAN